MAKPLFKRILVPHDFSSEADQALRVAGQLAGGSGTVTALHVIEPYYGPTDMTFATMVPPPESLVPEQRRELEGRVRKILGAAARRATVRVLVGDPGREIVLRADRRLSYAEVKKVLESVQAAGFLAVGLVAERPR